MDAHVNQHHNNNTQTINLTFRRLKYFVSICAIILSIVSVSLSANNKSLYIILLSIYVCMVTFSNIILSSYMLSNEYKIILNFMRARAPINVLAKPNIKLESFMSGSNTLSSVGVIVILALTPFEQINHNKFMFVMVIYNIVSKLGLIGLFVLCFPCIMSALGNNVQNTNHLFEHVADAIVTFGINSLIEEVDDIGLIDTDECCICMGNKPNAQVIPCKHNSFCSECITKVKICPYCRGTITKIKKLRVNMEISNA